MNGEGEAPPAAAAPTATTVPAAPPEPRRVRWFLLAVLLVVLGAAAAVYLLVDFGKSKGFRSESEAVFTALADGKAEEVYDGASFRFKQTLLVDKFVDIVERMNGTLGRFVEVVEVIDVDRANTVAGQTARVQLTLRFEHAVARGELSFHHRPGDVLPAEEGGRPRWRLLGMSVQIPPELVSKAAELEGRVERVRAPDEVIEQFHAILDDVRAGRGAEIHERAAPAFREGRTLERFQALLASHRAEMGEFVRVLAVISSAQNADRDRARIHALLQYERAKTTGTFEFMRVEDGWRMVGFKVVVPEPFLPRESSATSPEDEPGVLPTP